MTQNIGTLVAAPIKTVDSEDTFAAFEANDCKGGIHNSPTGLTISSHLKELGMLLFVEDEDKTYQLKEIEPDVWEEFQGDSSGSGSGLVVYKTTNVKESNIVNDVLQNETTILLSASGTTVTFSQSKYNYRFIEGRSTITIGTKTVTVMSIVDESTITIDYSFDGDPSEVLFDYTLNNYELDLTKTNYSTGKIDILSHEIVEGQHITTIKFDTRRNAERMRPGFELVIDWSDMEPTDFVSGELPSPIISTYTILTVSPGAGTTNRITVEGDFGLDSYPENNYGQLYWGYNGRLKYYISNAEHIINVFNNDPDITSPNSILVETVLPRPDISGSTYIISGVDIVTMRNTGSEDVTDNVFITPHDTETIDGNDSAILVVQNHSKTITSDGTNWNTISQNSTYVKCDKGDREYDVTFVGINAGGDWYRNKQTANSEWKGSNDYCKDLVFIGTNAGIRQNGTSVVAIGEDCGSFNQGDNVALVGEDAGRSNAADDTVCLGRDAGFGQGKTETDWGNKSINVGRRSGRNNRGNNSILIGAGTGSNNGMDPNIKTDKSGGDHLIAIGDNAGTKNNGNNTISLGRNAGYDNYEDSKLFIHSSEERIANHTLIYGDFDNRTLRLNGSLETVNVVTGTGKMSTVGDKCTFTEVNFTDNLQIGSEIFVETITAGTPDYWAKRTVKSIDSGVLITLNEPFIEFFKKENVVKLTSIGAVVTFSEIDFVYKFIENKSTITVKIDTIEETVTVTSIVDDYTITIDTAFTDDLSNVSFTHNLTAIDIEETEDFEYINPVINQVLDKVGFGGVITPTTDVDIHTSLNVGDSSDVDREGEITVSNNTNTTTISGGDVSIGGDATIYGNLTVNGGTVTQNTETVLIEDNILTINNGESGAGVTSGSAGIEVDRGTEYNYEFKFDETSDSFKIGETGSLQKVATREDVPNDEAVAFWNHSEQRFDTGNLTIASNGVLTTSTTDYETLVIEDDHIPNKKYVVDYVADNVSPGITELFIDGTNATPNINECLNIRGNCHITLPTAIIGDSFYISDVDMNFADNDVIIEGVSGTTINGIEDDNFEFNISNIKAQIKKVDTNAWRVFGSGGISSSTGGTGDEIEQIEITGLAFPTANAWVDVGISGTDLTSGSYMMTVTAANEIYTGMMSWFEGATDSEETDEIILHRAGSNPGTDIIYLRTKRNTTPGVLSLQMAQENAKPTGSDYTFKFRKMI